MIMGGHCVCGGVALLAEGVDRNPEVCLSLLWGHVALLAEGVDRNRHFLELVEDCMGSPSSRRAWIEIWEYRWP